MGRGKAVRFCAVGRATKPSRKSVPFVRIYDFNAFGLPQIASQFSTEDVSEPCDVAVDSQGNFYVADRALSSVTVFSPDGVPIRNISGPATTLGKPSAIVALDVDAQDTLFILNGDPPDQDYSVHVYNQVVAFPYGSDGDVSSISATSLENSQSIWGGGRPTGMDISGNMFVSQSKPSVPEDDAPSAIQVLIPTGSAAAGTQWAPIGRITGGQTKLVTPRAVAVDGDGNLYVADGDSVLVFGPTAQGNVAPIRVIAGPSTGLADCSDVIVDDSGNIYVASAPTKSPGTIRIFSPGATGDATPHTVIGGDILSVSGLAFPRHASPPVPVWERKEFAAVASLLLSYVQVDGEREPGHPIGPPEPPWASVDLLLAVAAYQLAGSLPEPARTEQQVVAMKMAAAAVRTELARLETTS